MKNLLFIALVALTVLLPTMVTAAEGTLTFSWEPATVEQVSSQGITELRVYQDSSDSTPFTSPPDAGTIVVATQIDGCSNFWATYASETDESERTEAIKVCEPSLEDPEPATRIISVGGFRLTIDFTPEN